VERHDRQMVCFLFCFLPISVLSCRYRLHLLTTRIGPGSANEVAHALISSIQGKRLSDPKKLEGPGPSRILRSRTPAKPALAKPPTRPVLRASAKKAPAKKTVV